MSMPLEKIDFKQPKFVLPAIAFIGLVLLGYLAIDLFQTPTEPPHNRYSSVEQETGINELQNKTDSFYLTIVESDTISIKKDHRVDISTEDKTTQQEVRREPLDRIKLWASNAVSFFGDIFTRGAIKVYIENEIPNDSIN